MQINVPNIYLMSRPDDATTATGENTAYTEVVIPRFCCPLNNNLHTSFVAGVHKLSIDMVGYI
jgi:hypothetical protein